MNISKRRLKELMLYAYKQGMNDGYAIEHTNIIEEEKRAIDRFIENNRDLFYDKRKKRNNHQ